MANTKFKLKTVEVRTSDKVGEYFYAKGDLLKKNGTVKKGKTVMAFGKNVPAIKRFFKSGRTVTLNCKPDNGGFLVLGLRKEATPAEAPAEAAAA